MKHIDILLLREPPTETQTLGALYVDRHHYAHTCEDRDRYLEAGGMKQAEITAIPRGYYRVTVTFSNRFKKDLPLVCDVPQFSGIRIHGGNSHEDTEGCILIGQERTKTGIRGCKTVLQGLIQYIHEVEARGDQVWMVVR